MQRKRAQVQYKSVIVTLIFITVVLGIIGVGAIFAQTSGDNNIIYAAYQKINGQLRIISDPSEVRNSEALISWNIEGPAGPQGPQGEQGPAGPQGPQGESGSAADVEELRDYISQLDTQITLIQARLDVLEDSALGPPTLYVDDVSVVEGNLGGPIPIRVYLSKPHDQDVTFWYETREGTAIGLLTYPGTGEEDFYQTWGRITIPSGALSVQIDVRIIGDTRLESDDTFFLELSLSTVPIADGTGIVTIIDDDAPGEKWDLTRIVQLQGAFSVWEGTGDTPTEIKLAVNLVSPDPDPSPATVTVHWDLVATGTATIDEDFTIPTPKILVFNPGETYKEIVVRITADAVEEIMMAETILIQITKVENALPSTYSVCIVTIFDDD